MRDLLLITAAVLICVWGCHSCISAIDDYPPIHTDWDEIERQRKALEYYTPPPLTDEEQRAKEIADSAWQAEMQQRREVYFNMMQAAGKAEKEWRKEHAREAEIMSDYGEGYDDAFLDRQSGAIGHSDEYGTDYDAGYSDGYSY